MKLGSVEITGRTVLAPMAGVTDLAFRKICRECGASYTYTEMVSAKALCYEDKKTARLLKLAPEEHPCAAQIFGSDPGAMREGAALALSASGADVIDINMGCPTPKITSSGDGSALMKNPELAARIVEEVKSAVKSPVTVKMRLGWDNALHAAEFAKRIEAAGADAIAVHGRTRAQMFSGSASVNSIAEIVRAVKIPVIANGDVFTAENAVSLLSETGAALCMIGRGSLGNPWIFEQSENALKGLPVPKLPPLSQRLDTALRQIELTSEYKGDRIAILEARKHLSWYLKGERGMSAYKSSINKMSSMAQLREIIAEIKENSYEGGRQLE